MKRLVLFISGLLMCGLSVAQNNLGSTDDMGRIALTAVVADESGVPSYAKRVLETKLREVVTRSGLSSTATTPRFVITASVNLLQKELTATAPPMTAVSLATTLFIGDAVSGQLFASYSYNTVKGVGTNEQRAYLSAIRGLKASDSELDAFVEKGKQKIVEYYNSQIDFLIKEAKALTDQEKYDEAFALLTSVPNVCKDAYTKAMEQISVVYQKKIDTESAVFLNQATAAWKANKSEEGARTAIELLSKIHPNSYCAGGGHNLVKEIEGYYAELETYRRDLEKRNWDHMVATEKAERDLQREQMQLDHKLAMRQSDNSVRASKAVYAAAVESARAWASKQTVVYNVRHWY